MRALVECATSADVYQALKDRDVAVIRNDIGVRITVQDFSIKVESGSPIINVRGGQGALTIDVDASPIITVYPHGSVIVYLKGQCRPTIQCRDKSQVNVTAYASSQSKIEAHGNSKLWLWTGGDSTVHANIYEKAFLNLRSVEQSYVRVGNFSEKAPIIVSYGEGRVYTFDTPPKPSLETLFDDEI